jgi:hypothetical protein
VMNREDLGHRGCLQVFPNVRLKILHNVLFIDKIRFAARSSALDCMGYAQLQGVQSIARNLSWNSTAQQVSDGG